MTTFYVTKFALSGGIMVCEGDEPGTDSLWVRLPGASYPQSFRKSEWHLSLDEAFAQAESMRAAKIASHEKSIAKLRKLKVKVKGVPAPIDAALLEGMSHEW